jgi:hypothetical protein
MPFPRLVVVSIISVRNWALTSWEVANINNKITNLRTNDAGRKRREGIIAVFGAAILSNYYLTVNSS